MDKILTKYDDNGVLAIVLYADTEKKLYFDAKKTEGVKTAELEDLFYRNLVVKTDSEITKAVELSGGTLVAGNAKQFKATDASDS